MDPKLNAKVYHPTLPHPLSLEEISEYVEENFNNDDCSFYINCKKVTLVNLIIDGIDYFTKLKMKKEREKQKKI